MNEPQRTPCRVCGAASPFTFRQPVLGREVDYFDCPACGYLQTETPTWLEQAYASAINSVDTGVMERNLANVTRVALTLLALGSLHGRVLDHAGGYGILVRLLRDFGVDARWYDKYCENLLARGFEARDDDPPFALLTAFEVFEHLEHPLKELEAMLARAPAVLLTTELVPTPGPAPQDWWYLGPEHGQHIGFFRMRTFKWMAQQLGCHHATYGPLHLFSRQPVPRRWRRFQRWKRIGPWLLKGRLRSRVVDDYNQLRQLG